MPVLNTDINLDQAPYYADFDQDDQYYMDLFKPSTAVQVREFNVLQQTILNQLANFGNSVFTPGSIVSGCTLSFSNNYPYVKILDTYANQTALTVTSLVNNYLVSNSGLQAYITNATQGYVVATPNLNTLYIKYINSAVNASTNAVIKVFQNDEVLNVVTSANINLGQVTVANTISSGSSNTTGTGCTVTVSNGVIFQKGLMLTVNPQTIIVDAYDNQPNNISVGFISQESIVTSLQDTTLLDNSQGAPNYNAPGADRLKIVPTLITTTTSTINTNSNTFFSVIDFVGGAPSYINQNASYLGSALGNQLATTSFDTNGNFVITPFVLRAKQLLDANGSYDSANIQITVDSGTGYVNGNKIQLVGSLITSIPKGNAIGIANSQILTTQYGSYIPVQEFVGIFDPTSFANVYLTNASIYGISNNIAKGISGNSITPTGSVIGTAQVVATRPISGQPNVNTAQYYLYLFNVTMNSGYTFANTRNIYCNTGGIVGSADVILTGSNAVLQNPSFAPLVYSLNQAAVSTLKNSSNTIDSQFTYLTSSGITILNNGTASVTIPSYVGGTNQLPYGTGYLTNTQDNQFMLIAESNALSINIGTATVALSNVMVTVANSANGMYVGGLICLANSTSSMTRQIASITNSTSVNVSVAFSTAYTSVNVAMAYLTGMNIPIAAEGANINITSSTGFTINLPQPLAGATTLSANIFFDILRTSASPAKKDLQGTTYVTINCSNNAGGTTGPWSLGFPDVAEILNVWVGSTYANTNPNLTSNFTLVNGQHDQYYGLASMLSNNAVLTSSSRILVEVACFQPDISSGAGFYSIDSYPINDAVTGYAANTLNTADVGSYTSIASGETYNLRNCVDFRPYVVNTAAYSNTISGATVNPSNTQTMNVSSYFLPYPDSNFQSSLQYYMGRYDVIGLSNSGNIIINQGTPALNPVPPSGIVNGMTLGTIQVPPYPTLTVDIANAFDNPACNLVSFVYETNRVYTMADIGGIDARLTQVEYYTSLSELELNAQNLLLTSASGNTRFQQGFLCDPFQDFSAANLNAQGFNCAIDPANTELKVTFKQTPVHLKYNAGGNTVISSDGRYITLGWSENANAFISQPFATEEINAAQDTLYDYIGKITLTPTGNYKPDVSYASDVVTASNVYTSYAGAQVSGSQNEVTSVTNLIIQEYLPQQVIGFYAWGLKPSTQHYIWFAGVNVTTSCKQLGSNNFGVLTTNGQGVLQGNFFVNPGTFHASTILFQIYDVNNLVTQSQIITSQASTSFFGTNIAYTQTTQTLQTVVEEVISGGSSNSGTTVTGGYAGNPGYGEDSGGSGTSGDGGDGDGGDDPLAQSFTIISSKLPNGVDGVYVTSIDLFFASKDASLGVTLQLQNMDSAGEITNEVVTNSKVHLWPNNVVISTNGTKATTFTFPSPILLESGQNYAMVIKPDGSNPNYNIWSAAIGQKDVATKAPVTTLSGTGIIFTSSMGTTWSAIQNQSLKFNLRIANFSYAAGVANLTNDDLEFFNLSNQTSNYQIGETIVYSNNVLSNANASVSNTSKVITANTSLYTNNTPIAILSTTNQTSDVVLITAINSGTQLTVNTTVSFTDSAATIYNLNPANGVLSYVNSTMMFVGNSTTNTASYLLTGSNYLGIGVTSGAWGNVNLTNVPYDNFMPKLAVAIPTVTTLQLSMKGLSNTNVGDSNTTILTYGTSSDMYYERTVLSKSNEMRYLSGAKSLSVSANMTSSSIYMSPVIDTSKFDSWLTYNLINADTSNSYYNAEINGVSNAINRYVSTTVTLSNGLNAEDMAVYVGAYFPSGSSIYVYAKIRNQYDSEAWETKAWTPLVTTNTVRSSLSNFLDFNEYTFGFPASNATATSAYLNTGNNSVVTYYTNAGTPLTDYNQFAIKIVLTGTNSALPPILTDYRAIAVASAH